MKKQTLRICLILLLSGVCWPLSLQAIDETQLREAALAEFGDIDLPLNENWQGQFDDMLERRRIRVLVVYNKLLYFLDGPQQRGITYEAFSEFERYLNARQKTKTLKIQVVFIPVSRRELLPALLDGRGDIAAANLTITPARLHQVDFTAPIYDEVNEVLVSHKDQPVINQVEALSAQSVWVRQSSSYYQSLAELNIAWRASGREPMQIVKANEHFEDSDLLEMLNAGLIPRMVVDDHKLTLWSEMFENIRVNPAIKFRENGEIAWAVRKNSPKLRQVLNEFIAKHKKGTLFGNILFKRYLKNNQWIKSPLSKAELKKFHDLVMLFQHYGQRYEFDWLMLAALAYQESKLEQDTRSPAGAVGIMQVLPSTAAAPEVGIDNIVGSMENNIHAGTKYLSLLRDKYLNEPELDPLNRTLLTFASYNAGPTKIRRLRNKAAKHGLNPNLWFDNMEVLAARAIGRETVQYVGNIYKYYLAYQRIAEQLRLKDKAAAEKTVQSQ
jgi:membrane-bound lytic murein transglycosylase MltF